MASKAFHDRLTSKCYLAVLQGHLDPSLYPTVSSPPPLRESRAVSSTKRQEETWQIAARETLLTSYLAALATIPQHPQDEQLAKLRDTSRETFLKSPKLRKQLRKVVQRYGIVVDISHHAEESSSEATSEAAQITHTDYKVPTGLDLSSYISDSPPFYRLSKDVGMCADTEAVCKADVSKKPRSAPPLYINLPIEIIPNDFRMRWGDNESDGRAAQTKLDVLQYGLMTTPHGDVPVTKVLLTPRSGRRHQLRLHCLALGHPIGMKWHAIAIYDVCSW